MSKTKAYIFTLGCKVNQYESRSLAEAWEEKGYERAGNPADARIILVNSCAVTENALSDLRQEVRKLNRINPEADIIITGCAAQVFGEDLAGLPGVVRVVPQDRKASLHQGPGAEVFPNQGWPGFRISGYGRARPVVKIQDGCSHGCTYCIVPLTRGRSVSRPKKEILAEVARLLAAGFREIILSGINLRHYGRDLEKGDNFWTLLLFLEQELGPEWAGRARFRLSSLEPGQLDAQALEVLSGSRMICSHLHLSLQSGDKGVLRRMGRGHYDPDTVFDFLRELSAAWPVLGLGADIIAGFPGETGDEFKTTYDYCNELALTYAHVFPYSPRPGTRAQIMAKDMGGMLPVEKKKHRAFLLRSLVADKKKAFVAKVAGLERLNVAVKGLAPGSGVCEYYLPCVFTGEDHPREVRKIYAARPVEVVKNKIMVELDQEGGAQ